MLDKQYLLKHRKHLEGQLKRANAELAEIEKLERDCPKVMDVMNGYFIDPALQRLANVCEHIADDTVLVKLYEAVVVVENEDVNDLDEDILHYSNPYWCITKLANIQRIDQDAWESVKRVLENVEQDRRRRVLEAADEIHVSIERKVAKIFGQFAKKD